MITPEINSIFRLPDVKSGMYHGQWTGYTVTIFGAGHLGKDLSIKVEEGIRGVCTIVVAVHDNGDAFVYANMSKNSAAEKETEPITPEYLKQLMEVRKTRIGPAITEMNAELITRLPELAKHCFITVAVDKITKDMPDDTADLLVQVFSEKGFDIRIELDKEGTRIFTISMS